MHQEMKQRLHEGLVLSQSLGMTSVRDPHHRDLGDLLHESHDRVDVVVVASLSVVQEAVLQLRELLQRQLPNVRVVDVQQTLQKAEDVRLRIALRTHSHAQRVVGEESEQVVAAERLAEPSVEQEALRGREQAALADLEEQPQRPLR